jgi:hypothetical protein
VPETSINAAGKPIFSEHARILNQSTHMRAAQDMIGAFDDTSRRIALDEDDQARFSGWEITNKQSFQQEMVEFLTYQARFVKL